MISGIGLVLNANRTWTTARSPTIQITKISNVFSGMRMASTEVKQQDWELTLGLQHLTGALRAIGQGQGDNFVETGEFDL